MHSPTLIELHFLAWIFVLLPFAPSPVVGTLSRDAFDAETHLAQKSSALDTDQPHTMVKRVFGAIPLARNLATLVYKQNVKPVLETTFTHLIPQYLSVINPGRLAARQGEHPEFPPQHTGDLKKFPGGPPSGESGDGPDDEDDKNDKDDKDESLRDVMARLIEAHTIPHVMRDYVRENPWGLAYLSVLEERVRSRVIDQMVDHLYQQDRFPTISGDVKSNCQGMECQNIRLSTLTSTATPTAAAFSFATTASAGWSSLRSKYATYFSGVSSTTRQASSAATVDASVGPRVYPMFTSTFPSAFERFLAATTAPTTRTTATASVVAASSTSTVPAIFAGDEDWSVVLWDFSASAKQESASGRTGGGDSEAQSNAAIATAKVPTLIGSLAALAIVAILGM